MEPVGAATQVCGQMQRAGEVQAVVGAAAGAVGAIVVAAGRGERFRPGGEASGKRPKQFWPLAGQPVLAWTLTQVARTEAIEGLVVVVPPEYCDSRAGQSGGDLAWLWQEGTAWREKLWGIVRGGANRQESVWRGLQTLPARCRWVVVQDGVRPLASPALYDRVLRAAQQMGPGGGAAIAAIPVRETLKRATATSPQGGGSAWRVQETVDRSMLWAAQTPQVVFRPWLEEAFRRAQAEGWQASDEAGLLERAGFPVQLVEGEAANIKITYRQDLSVAEALLRAEIAAEGVLPGRTELRSAVAAGGVPAVRVAGAKVAARRMRVGMGADVHRLVEGRPLILGGCAIPFDKGLAGHSDADVLTHAIIDGCLGAAGLGDIGQHFADTDSRWAKARSVDWLPQVRTWLEQAGWQVEYVDAVVWAERPKLAPYREMIQQELARGLGITPAQVSVKAKTGEGLGWVGQGEGMAAQAVVTLGPVR
ncbi:MAG: 2-C-methyl-D-erythritol 2,4-cyclodiphosphate synthase [Limnochordaceae bacterium]|nr:2-C-methyl-D-erythritol 2,4-cyclodiphosphate synthase [Limnochordaceae bacterium]